MMREQTGSALRCLSCAKIRVALAVVGIWIMFSMAASAHSHIVMTKFLVDVPVEQRSTVDSLLRTQAGVFSTSWSKRRPLLIVVYDRTKTNRHKLKLCIMNQFIIHNSQFWLRDPTIKN